MKITVMCGAGAMSTFVAHRLRRACASAGRDDLVGVSTLKAGVLPGTDLLLLGNHVPSDVETVVEAEEAGTAVVRLPANIASDLDGQRTLDLVDQALASRPGPTQTSRATQHSRSTLSTRNAPYTGEANTTDDEGV